jgi:hypothetical protein
MSDKTKFYFCEFFLAVPFLILNENFWDDSAERLFLQEKAVLEETCLALGTGWLAACFDLASCFCLVRAIKLNIVQLMWPLPTTRLGSPLAQRSRACTMGLLLESSGSRAQLRCEWHFGVLEKIFLPSMIGMQWYAGLSLVVLGRLSCGCTKLAHLLPEGSRKLGSLSTFLSWKQSALGLSSFLLSLFRRIGYEFIMP